MGRSVANSRSSITYDRNLRRYLTAFLDLRGILSALQNERRVVRLVKAQPGGQAVMAMTDQFYTERCFTGEEQYED